MGCGCNRTNRGTRLKQQKSVKSKSSKNKSTITRISSSSIKLNLKASACMSCPESTQNKEERKRGIRVCKKTNRLINNLVRDPRFVCPIGKWNSIT